MRRISIIGSGGAGKSTLARALGDLLNLPVIHLDAVHWKPGWVETPKGEWRTVVQELIGNDEWIIDGNYGGTMEMRLAASDTVFYLDYPRRVCIYRALRRCITYYNRTRPDMGPGCNEKLDFEFLAWIWNFPNRSGAEIEKRLSALNDSVRVIRHRSPAETSRFLSKLKEARD